jgi:hypothetical protein
VPKPEDPRSEWVEITTFGAEEEWIKGRCVHFDPVAVITVWPDEQLVAWLCVDCDAQLPASFRPDPRDFADPFDLDPEPFELFASDIRPTDFSASPKR